MNKQKKTLTFEINIYITLNMDPVLVIRLVHIEPAFYISLFGKGIYHFKTSMNYLSVLFKLKPSLYFCKLLQHSFIISVKGVI